MPYSFRKTAKNLRNCSKSWTFRSLKTESPVHWKKRGLWLSELVIPFWLDHHSFWVDGPWLSWSPKIIWQDSFKRRLKPLLVNRAWAFVGLISYSLYLVHMPVVFYLRRFTIRDWPWIFPSNQGTWFWTREALVAASLIVAAAVVLSTTTYFTIERPMLRLKSRLPA